MGQDGHRPCSPEASLCVGRHIVSRSRETRSESCSEDQKFGQQGREDKKTSHGEGA